MRSLSRWRWPHSLRHLPAHRRSDLRLFSAVDAGVPLEGAPSGLCRPDVAVGRETQRSGLARSGGLLQRLAVVRHLSALTGPPTAQHATHYMKNCSEAILPSLTS